MPSQRYAPSSGSLPIRDISPSNMHTELLVCSVLSNTPCGYHRRPRTSTGHTLLQPYPGLPVCNTTYARHPSLEYPLFLAEDKVPDRTYRTTEDSSRWCYPRSVPRYVVPLRIRRPRRFGSWSLRHHQDYLAGPAISFASPGQHARTDTLDSKPHSDRAALWSLALEFFAVSWACPAWSPLVRR
jgi:hypothetical protein